MKSCGVSLLECLPWGQGTAQVALHHHRQHVGNIAGVSRMAVRLQDTVWVKNTYILNYSKLVLILPQGCDVGDAKLERVNTIGPSVSFRQFLFAMLDYCHASVIH